MTDDNKGNEPADRPRLKVTDRRKFTADGEARTPTTDDETPPGSPEAEGTTATPPGPTRPQSAAPAETPGAVPGETPDAAAAESPNAATDGDTTKPSTTAAEDLDATDEAPRIAAPQPSMADLPRDFSAFVESMYLEAMLYMGAMPHPRTGEVVQDIELARYKIDLLGMIAEKTEGNLTDDEKRQLEEIIYQLRMVFVQQAK